MDQEIYEQMEHLGEIHWWFRAKRKIILFLLDKYVVRNRENKILDIGCGNGLMLKYLEKYGEVFAIDNNELALKYARDKTIYTKNVQKASLPDKIPFNIKFDLVTSFDVLEHITDDLKALIKIKEILKEGGGRVFCTVPAYDFLWSDHDSVHNHKRRYTLKKIKKLFRQAGFKIEKITYFNTFLFPSIALVRLIKRVLKIKGPDLAKNNVFLNWLLEKVFSAERFFLQKFDFPFGVSILVIAKK